MNTKDKIAVMQAFNDGEKIKHRHGKELWSTWDREEDGEPSWNWIDNSYEIVPDPRTFELEENQYLEVYEKGAHLRGKIIRIEGPGKFKEVIK